MGHSSVTIAFRMVTAAALCVAGISVALAQPGGGRSQGQHGGEHGGGMHRPVYQRKGFDGRKGPDKRHDDFRFKHRPFFPRRIEPNVQSGWFTRPYPYHLDFYKMKYGGSYAPYFGNLYGPPQVVTAPPYYGPYYGGWGLGDGGYGTDGYGGMPWAQPGFPAMNGYAAPAEEVAPINQPNMQSNGEGLPVPEE